MNIHQLRAICEVVRQGLRMSTAAETLFRSQSGISRQILEIEADLGVQIFRRGKNKIESLTPAGAEVVRVAERILQDLDTLRLIGKEYSADDVGDFTIATTHTHARYSLPRIIEAFSERYPRVRVTLCQGDPQQCYEMVADGKADLAITTEGRQPLDDLASLPVYRLTRCIIAPKGHPILKQKPLTLETLSKYPIIAFGPAFSSRQVVDEAFTQAGIKPNVVLRAVDADVTKAYVERGMGISVLAKVAYDPAKDKNLRLIDADHLFKSNTLNVAVRRNSYLRSFIPAFVAMYAPHIPQGDIRQALESGDCPATSLQDLPEMTGAS